jgi:hypothetical protein
VVETGEGAMPGSFVLGRLVLAVRVLEDFVASVLRSSPMD